LPLQLWDTERLDGTITLVHSSSMRQFNWGYTQFSQFNADDTLLLVSGVYLGPHQWRFYTEAWGGPCPCRHIPGHPCGHPVPTKYKNYEFIMILHTSAKSGTIVTQRSTRVN